MISNLKIMSHGFKSQFQLFFHVYVTSVCNKHYSFEKYLVVLQKMEAKCSVGKVKFDKTAFWNYMDFQ